MSQNPFEPFINQLAELVAERVKIQIQDLKPDSAPTSDNEVLLTREETCEFLKINSSTLWDWTNKNKVTAYGIGNRRYYKRSELLNSLKELKK